MSWKLVFNLNIDSVFSLSPLLKGRSNPEQKIQTLPGVAGKQRQWIWIPTSSPEMFWPALVYNKHPEKLANIDFWVGEESFSLLFLLLCSKRFATTPAVSLLSFLCECVSVCLRAENRHFYFIMAFSCDL